ncbi:MAG: winged helix-turn-helix domain-containing protein [Candidatus Marinimicrobia bacterium]|nr:winged helix-turn-helix domain-containing protein [Candidatus Neomarinimicrobiota bacterium]MDD5582435.1 winged helix-turn-helix domain-containing protein [Candidatus Neomarinimicrobiota bacterium]
MEVQVGNIAGKVWQLLHEEGPKSVSTLVKETGEKKDFVLMAIGWLLREDKLSTEVKGNCTLFSLK